MLKTTAMLLKELEGYASPADKLTRLVRDGTYIKIINGLYETERTVPGYLIAESIYGPSYLSFEFALSYHGLIPEAVYEFASATFEKKKKKKYITPLGTFTYRDIPSGAYVYGVDIVQEGAYSFKIASAEKALCGLSRSGFFQHTAFYGGTALRIFYGLDRFSEDLDFSLMDANQDFDIKSYFPILEKEIRSYGLNVEIKEKEKTLDSNILFFHLK